MNAPGRLNGALSPVSTDGTDWSPVTRYQSLGGAESPYSPLVPQSNRNFTPPASGHNSTNTTDGPMAGGMGRPPPPPSNGNPSPPSSIARSSDGTGLYASSMADTSSNGRKMTLLEDTLAEHYRVLKAYLGPYLRDEAGNPRPSRAKDKLTRLSPVQFQELSTDVYDESLRREDDRKRGGPGAPGNETPKYLLPKTNFHPKRNQARQKLSTLPLERFRQLATDVYYELERRCPRFAGGDIGRTNSPALSVASRTSGRGPPSRVGTPNSMNGGMRGGPRPPPGPAGYRNGPPGPPGAGPNQLGRPLPKTFQQNTIVPNKGTMVEDDDDDNDDEDAFNLEGAAPRESRRHTNKSLNLEQQKLVSDLQSKVTDFEAKVGSLEESLRDKDAEIQKLKETDQMRDSNTVSERAEWDDLRTSLEDKVEQAESLNSSLRSELDRIRSENEETERNLRAQIAELQARAEQQQSSGEGEEQWRRRAEELEQELDEQQRVTDEVRRDASQFLQEMRDLSNRTDAAMEKEERLCKQVSSLETEIQDWKARYARAKAQVRSLKTSSIGLASLASPDISNYARDASFAAPDGLVKDVHVTKFQLSIDELLQVARRSDPEHTLESMRHVVKCVRAITGDIDSTPLSQMQSPSSSVNGDAYASPEKQQVKLKARVSATANNLITASKNHVSSGGLSPVSLLDAAASHLSTAVVELLKQVKVRPTPEEELQNSEEDDRPMPLKPNGYTSYNPYAQNSVNGTGSSPTIGHQRHRSRGGSSSTTGYSAYSSPYSTYDRQSAAYSALGVQRDPGMAEFKNYLDDQTALLVQSIQPLVHMIRSGPVSSPADEQQVSDHMQDISRAVQDTVSRTREAVVDLGNAALKKHTVPVVEVLATCRQNLLAVDVREGGQEKIPPLAFKTARTMKELVLRVERIESGELTVDQTLKDDF
ncbi:hypothetical protein M011DRAFT_441760 [Sporormia fimetaria CBS 119925]|uniref:GIT Spa2 homology (SHD) domain-containing protein n=1 Tax=Sporormia fimetaria CBS 119925 TaxID=1340428 RepID=A0A6A6VCN1_9PLEO|nr:hypothetical protein M011DRAFT_441760 [Sporormia fimetaria CBS 119925]